jgi:hypothetical protein
MVVQINDPNSGNIFGRLGASIGQGFSEQFPKQLQANREASAIEGLRNQKEPLDTLQQLAALRRSGISGQEAAQYIPLIQRQQERDIYNKKSETSKVQEHNKVQSNEPGKIESAQDINIHVPQENGFVSRDAIKDYKSSLLRAPKTEEIEDLARTKFLARNPSMGITEAEGLARNEINTNREAQKTANAELRTDLNTRMALDLQGGGLGDFKDISGEIQKDLIDQAEHMVNKQGKSPEEAAQIVGDIALELGKTANSVRESGSWHNMFRSSKTKEQELKDQKEIFSKYGYDELFNNFAAAEMGITRLQAANILDPIKNTEVQSELAKIKKIPAQARKLKDDQLDSLIMKIKPSDNLHAIEYELREKGVDVNQFKQRVSKLKNEKQIALSDEQIHQQKAAISNSHLGDILFKIF